MLGAFMRLSDSGLSCAEWTGCDGGVTPRSARANIHEAAQARPFGPVTLTKA